MSDMGSNKPIKLSKKEVRDAENELFEHLRPVSDLLQKLGWNRLDLTNRMKVPALKSFLKDQ